MVKIKAILKSMAVAGLVVLYGLTDYSKSFKLGYQGGNFHIDSYSKAFFLFVIYTFVSYVFLFRKKEKNNTGEKQKTDKF